MTDALAVEGASDGCVLGTVLHLRNVLDDHRDDNRNHGYATVLLHTLHRSCDQLLTSL